MCHAPKRCPNSCAITTLLLKFSNLNESTTISTLEKVEAIPIPLISLSISPRTTSAFKLSVNDEISSLCIENRLDKLSIFLSNSNF